MAQKNEPPKPGLKQEALAVLGISLSLFLYLSLFAYIFKFDANSSAKVGTVIAEVLLAFIGWGAYMLPTLLLISPSLSQEILMVSYRCLR